MSKNVRNKGNFTESNFEITTVSLHWYKNKTLKYFTVHSLYYHISDIAKLFNAFVWLQNNSF